MPAEALTIAQENEREFQTGRVLTVAGGHFINDAFTAFLPPLLPILIDRLSLTLTLAGSLTAISQFPAVLNPFIGYLADRVNLRYFVILAPAVTASLFSAIGLTPSYLVLAVLLFASGISVAAFHAPAPAMIAQVSGKQVGRGMGFFMAAGELGRTVGPLLAVWAVSTWTLEGVYRIMVLGWAASLVLYFRLRDIPAQPGRQGGLRAALPHFKRIFLPLAGIVFFRNFIVVSLTIYLPTFMDQQGASLWIAGASLTIFEGAGVFGALVSGSVSDRLGHKRVLIFAILASAGLMLLFLQISGWLIVPVLLALGIVALSMQPVLMTVVQENFPHHRAVSNGLFMTLAFLLRTIGILAIGAMGDWLGLRTAFYISVLVSLLAIPAIFALPSRPGGSDTR